MSTTRLTLEKARFFLDQAEKATGPEPHGFANNLEAAIVFARSITLHLQKEFSNRPGFEAWYSSQQQKLRANAFAKFLVEKRNYVLKEGPARTNRVIEVSMTASLSISGSASVVVIRGKPWYRRSPRVLFEDATYPLREKIHQLKERTRARRLRGAQRKIAQPSTVRHNVFFSEPEWKDTPAIQLVRQLLEEFEAMVSEAEKLFAGEKNGNAA